MLSLGVDVSERPPRAVAVDERGEVPARACAATPDAAGDLGLPDAVAIGAARLAMNAAA